MTINAERVGQTPGVQEVGFGSARCLSVPVSLRTFGIHRINGHTALKQLLNGGPLTGLNGHGQMRAGRDQFLPLAPTFDAMLEGQVLNDFALWVDDYHIVVVLGPVKAGIMGNAFPAHDFIHKFAGTRPLALIVSRPDTVTLLGCSSLRLFDKSSRVDRCSGLNPRRIWVKEPCSTPGLAARPIIVRSQIGFKIYGGKVIHGLAPLRSGGLL